MQIVTEQDFEKEKQKESAYKWYDLNDLYSKQFTLSDLFQGRRIVYDRYVHCNIWNEHTNQPYFINFLNSGGYKKVGKIFKSFNLKDSSQSAANFNYREPISYQLIRTIDCFLNSLSKESFISVYRQVRKEIIEARQFLDGLTLKFSADPWDIATMSMRGITSCMAWSSSHSRSLVGSILDPCCGIIYLERKDGQMVARSVVRVVKENGLIKILMERPYISDKGKLQDKKCLIVNIFKIFLQTKSKCQVINPEKASADVLIPHFDYLLDLPENLRSYRDSHVKYAPSLKKLNEKMSY